MSNQVVEAEYKEVVPDIIVSAVLPEQVDYVWEKIWLFVQRCCKRSNGRHNPYTVRDQIKNNEINLWIVISTEDDSIIGFGTTSIVSYATGMRMLEIVHLGGSKIDEWVDDGWKVLEKWAKDNGCHGLQALGRPGLKHVTTKKDNKWKQKEVFFEKKFKEDN